MADIELKLGQAPVTFKNGNKGIARVEGNNAAWICICGAILPLLGRCYFQFGHDCHTVCPDCKRSYRVEGDTDKRAVHIREQ
jgi:hypothetical protein